MNDLLNDDEFIQNYDYRRRFRLFCLAAFCVNAAFTSVIYFDKPEDLALSLYIGGMIFALPVTLACVMVFGQKKVNTVKLSTITWALAALFGTFYAGILFTVIIINIIKSHKLQTITLEWALIFFLTYLITFGITASLIPSIAKWNKKYKNGRSTELPK